MAKALNAPIIEWHIKSTTKAQQGLYEYDAVSRLRDSQLGDERVKDIGNYIKRGKMWEAFTSETRPILLIDEIDKADIEFPNDLLLELDRMQFYVYETQQTIKAEQRPIVMITSNNEKELPDAFLRRCFFHYIRFPDRETMTQIVDVHFPDLQRNLLREALNVFYDIREVPGLKKKPSTSELLDWLKLLMVEDMSPESLRSKDSKQLIRRCTARCSRTSRTSICSSAWPSWRGGSSASNHGGEENAMFVNFFLELRNAKLPVSIKEYLALMEAMDKGVADYSVDDFYYLSRAALVKDERNLDKFDRVFGTVFKGLEALPAEGIAAEIPRNGCASWPRSFSPKRRRSRSRRWAAGRSSWRR